MIRAIRASERIPRVVASCSKRCWGRGQSTLSNSRHLSSLDSKREQQDDGETNVPSSPLTISSLAAAVDPVATTAVTYAAMDPVWQHFLETVITWGVPALAIAGGAAAAARLRPRAKEKRPSRASNPVAELYDDVYATTEKIKQRSPAEELMQFLRELTSRGSKKSKQTLVRQNRGIPPQQFITLTHWNQKLESYQYDVTCATRSKSVAAACYRQQSFDRALSTALLSGAESHALTPSTRARLVELEKDFLRKGAKLVRKIQSHQTELTRLSIEEEMEAMGVTPFQMDPPEKGEQQHRGEDGKSAETSPPANKTVKKKKQIPEKDKTTHWNKLQEAQRKLLELELQFIRELIAALGTQRATALEVALVGDVAARGTGGLLTQLQRRPLATLLPVLLAKRPATVDAGATASSEGAGEEDRPSNTSDATILSAAESPPAATTNGKVADAAADAAADAPADAPADAAADAAVDVAAAARPRLFVTRFIGDMQASQVERLREEVTAILRSAAAADEALVVLQSGGGTVTGYGLAAGQLQRLRRAGLRVTVVAEQVAASGGYMMCCVGDRIVGSPFCAFGSIGVLSEMPNVHSRLKREGVEWQTVTAGNYKRTLTPFKEVTPEDFDKAKQDLESILSMFQKFVHEHRPQLDIAAVATGEVWFGNDAVARGLCDEISTADDVLVDYVDRGWDVFEVEYRHPRRGLANRLGIGVEGASSESSPSSCEEGDGMLRRGLRWLVQTVVSEVKSVLVAESEHMTQQPQPQLGLKYMARYDGTDRIRTVTDSSR